VIRPQRQIFFFFFYATVVTAAQFYVGRSRRISGAHRRRPVRSDEFIRPLIPYFSALWWLTRAVFDSPSYCFLKFRCLILGFVHFFLILRR